MNKKQIALLGGAFNPVTMGHIQIANFVLNSTDIEEVWLSPCCFHPYDKEMVSSYHRFKMCELATILEPKIKVFNYEIEYKPTCTYDFLHTLLLQPDFKKYKFSYIVGMDNANDFDNWIESEKLKKMMRFIVVSRQGFKPKKNINWYCKLPHIYLNPKDSIVEMSSTQIRKWIKDGKFLLVYEYLPYAVYYYAVMSGKHDLY